jgi:tripartite-type tricarboxylate transporter receptor subunit TctC
MAVQYSCLLGFSSRLAMAFLVAALAAPPGRTLADEFDVLKGETVRVIASAVAGDTSDFETRLLVKHLQMILPDTTFRISNQGAGGGAEAMVELVNASGRVPTIAATSNSVLYRPLLTPAGTPYDLTKMKWIGSTARATRLLVMRRGLGGTTLETLRALGRQPVAGGGGSTGSSAIEPLLLNAITGLRMKVLTGLSEPERKTLILAGKVDVYTGTLFAVKPEFDAGEMLPVVRFTSDMGDPSLDGVPLLADVARPDAPKDLLFLLEGLYKVGGNMISAAPATPPAVVEALRSAFRKVVVDPVYVDTMTKNRLHVSPTDGVELAELVNMILSPTSHMGEVLRAAVECGKRMSDAGATGCN